VLRDTSLQVMSGAGAVALALLSMVAVTSPSVAARQSVSTSACKAHIVDARIEGDPGIEVVCPNATVAEFFAALHEATGLVSEYPDEFASARVSVSRRAVPLLEVLENALSAFNFAVWRDHQAASRVRVTIVDLKTSSGTDRKDRPNVPVSAQSEEPSRESAVEHGSSPPRDDSAAVMPTAAPLNDAWEQERVRETFADSVELAMPLEPQPADPGSGLVPEPSQ
jgi:hypothetical protein